jgi:hypothetical protein
MRLEAIATTLGHRSLRMTLTYARIANKTVADEYATASAKIDALYTNSDPEQQLRQLAVEHRRMLANGWCNRPIDTDMPRPAHAPLASWVATDRSTPPRRSRSSTTARSS